MRLKRKGDEEVLEADLTPMIDVTFMLIFFFMMVTNFQRTEQAEEVVLPKSSLVKPPEEPFEHKVIIHLNKEGLAIFGGHEIKIESLKIYLDQAAEAFRLTADNVSDATVVVRAHEYSRAGQVQDLIKKCQESGFEKFALRATGTSKTVYPSRR